MWRPRKLISVSRLTEINKTVSAYYSRRSDSRNADSYKAVKARKSVDGNVVTCLRNGISVDRILRYLNVIN
ncbi:hypothetical protein ANN_03091 [Periplaneta americana]|uniref:Uncharacterized protein n=1 Tax=Periplaneta americana TaxID=6978 RepID=A0ABQ8U1C1_PERAM|nr:hypothetical protein ANN_03091 [Periplaneta americana]